MLIILVMNDLFENIFPLYIDSDKSIKMQNIQRKEKLRFY